MSRRKARQHTRTVNNKKILVNRGVYYDNPVKDVRGFRGRRNLRKVVTEESQPVDPGPVHNFCLTPGPLEDQDSVPRKPEKDGKLYRRRPRTRWQLPGRILTATIAPNGKYKNNQLQSADLSNQNMKNSSFLSDKITMTSFAWATLDGSVFEGPVVDSRDFNTVKRHKLHLLSFRNASLRDVTFSRADLQIIDLRGADLAGAKFQHCVLADYERNFDVTDSNITAEQIQSIQVRPTPLIPSHHKDSELDPAEYIMYRPYSLRDVAEKLEVDPKELLVEIWAGDIEVRKNGSQQKVVGEYNKDTHHIPQWELQRLMETKR